VNVLKGLHAQEVTVQDAIEAVDILTKKKVRRALLRQRRAVPRSQHQG